MGQKPSRPKAWPRHPITNFLCTRKVCEIINSTETGAPKGSYVRKKRQAKFGYTDADLPLEKELLYSIRKKIGTNLELAPVKFFKIQWLHRSVENSKSHSNIPSSFIVPYRLKDECLLGQQTVGMTHERFVCLD